MIFDKITNWDTYFFGEIFDQMFNDLKKISLETKNGTYFENENYYFKVMSYDTKEESDIIENHKREVDIQIVLSGSEKIKLYDLEDVEVIKDYNIITDCQFYRNINSPHSEVILRPGLMGVFFSQDIHHPQFCIEKSEHIKKIVIKVNEKVFS